MNLGLVWFASWESLAWPGTSLEVACKLFGSGPQDARYSLAWVCMQVISLDSEAREIVSLGQA